MRRLVLPALALVLLATACGDSSSSLPSVDDPATVKLNANDDGALAFLRVGGELSVRLGVESGTDWEILDEPDSEILKGGDSYVFVPSDPGSGRSYRRFDFTAIGGGDTTLSFAETGGAERIVVYSVTVVE